MSAERWDLFMIRKSVSEPLLTVGTQSGSDYDTFTLTLQKGAAVLEMELNRHDLDELAEWVATGTTSTATIRCYSADRQKPEPPGDTQT